MRQYPVVLALLLAASATQAAELDVSSVIDAVTVYPDGATVTRVIRVDLPQGDSVLRARDFPPGLDPATLRVTYSVRGARWVPLYDARLDTGAKDRKPALELVRRAEIVQQTGVDWNDVALAVSTARTAKGGNAPELRPLIVRYPEPPRPPAMPRGLRQDKMSEFAAGAMQQAPATVNAPAPAKEREAEIETGGYQVVFRVPGRVAIAAHEGARSFRVASSSIAPELLVRAAPALDDTAYLEAAFKQGDDAPLLPGRVSLYRDGVFVGRGQMTLTSKDETVRLGFGADDEIKIARTTARKAEGSAGIISSAKIDEREFKISVRNGHDSAVRITVEDQLPVSEVDDVKVEMLPVSTPPTERDVRNRRGVVAWTFDAAGGEAREIKFAWRVRWRADKAITYEPAQM